MEPTCSITSDHGEEVSPEAFAGYECILCHQRGSLLVCSNAERYTCRACVCRECFRRWGWSWERYTNPDKDEPFFCPRCLVSEPVLTLSVEEEEKQDVLDGYELASETDMLRAHQLREKLSFAQAFYHCNRRPYFPTVDSYRRGYRGKHSKEREYENQAEGHRTLIQREPCSREETIMADQVSPLTDYGADGHERCCRLGSGTHSSHPLLLCNACPAAYHAPSCLDFERSDHSGWPGLVCFPWMLNRGQETRPQLWFCAPCRHKRLPAWFGTASPANSVSELERSDHDGNMPRPAVILNALARYCRLASPPRQFGGPRFVVLSLFDGIASARHAMTLLGIPPTLVRYYASEIDRDALAVVQALYPDVRQLGPVEGLAAFDDLPDTVDLLIGGSPCTALSGLGKRKGLFDGASALFFEFLRIKRVMKPRFYLFENVSSMRISDKRRIHRLLSGYEGATDTSATGQKPRRDCYLVELDAARVTASLRRRLYVANFPLPHTSAALPDWNLRLQDILDADGSVAESSKAFCITTNNMQGRPGDSRFNVVALPAQGIRRGLRIHEVEKCLGFPAGYTSVLANRPSAAMPRRWRLLGNAFAPPMIALLIWPLMEHSPLGGYLEREAVMARLERACRQQALSSCNEAPVSLGLESVPIANE
ncbi:hypothetical protein CCYA_CCYA02G0454 [Cyanidiococcus yangmingshanensis]|nr:hypothetical protein CCYA_CCYA02G0454 [Cyanidiococcus yangmingshanensis]